MSAEKLGFLRDLLFTTESPAGVVVNLAILLLFACGLVDVVTALRRLWRERKTLEQARAKLAAAARRGALGGGADVVAILGIPRDSLVGRRVERVLQLRSAGLRHPGMLRELSGDRLAGVGALARYIGAILTLLGLLGTVLGLSFALFNIQEAMGKVGNLSAFPELLRALGQTLLGMRTAFACTMAGLIAALLLSACNHAVSRLQARVSADLEELVTFELLTALERADPGADEAARVFAQRLVEAGEKLDGLREQVTAAGGVYEASSQQIAAAAQALGAHVERFGRSTAEMAAGQQAVAEAARDTAEALRVGQKAYQETLDRHLQELRAVVARSQETASGLAAAQSSALTIFSDLVFDVRTHLSEVARQQQEATAGQARSLEAALEAALSQKLEILRQVKEQNREGIDRLVIEQSAALQALRDLVIDLRSQIAPGFPLSPANGRGSHPVAQVQQ